MPLFAHPGGCRQCHDRLEQNVPLAAPPEKGKANKAVEALLAKALGARTGDVNVVGGLTSPRKVVRITGATVEAVRTALGLEEK